MHWEHFTHYSKAKQEKMGQICYHSKASKEEEKWEMFFCKLKNLLYQLKDSLKV